MKQYHYIMAIVFALNACGGNSETKVSEVTVEPAIPENGDVLVLSNPLEGVLDSYNNANILKIRDSKFKGSVNVYLFADTTKRGDKLKISAERRTYRLTMLRTGFMNKITEAPAVKLWFADKSDLSSSVFMLFVEPDLKKDDPNFIPYSIEILKKAGIEFERIVK